MKNTILDYKAINYNFYYKDQLLFIYKDISYLLFSVGTIKSPMGVLLLKYKRFFSLKNRIRVISQHFDHTIELKKEKKHLCLFLNNQGKIQKLNITSPFKILGNFEGDIFVNDVFFGRVFQKFENRNSIYYFSFQQEDHLLIYYCLVLFSVKYYYYTDEVA